MNTEKKSSVNPDISIKDLSKAEIEASLDVYKALRLMTEVFHERVADDKKWDTYLETYIKPEYEIRNLVFNAPTIAQDKKMVPGFSTSAKTRPLIIAKMDEYTREKLVNIKSARLIEELFVFIYRNNRPEAMSGYNDDLVMSYAIALWVRDTALKLRKNKDDHQRSMMGAMINMRGKDFGDGFSVSKNKPKDNPFEMQVGKDKEDLTWLLG